jgi:regulatory protein
MVRLRSPQVAKSAKAAALRFLKIRPRSIAELKEKLKVKGFSQEEIATTVLELMASGLLDDRAFTKSWINYRLARPFGFRRIMLELKDKGIDPQLIEESIAEARGGVQIDSVIEDLVRRRWQRLSAIDPLKKKKKVLDFLLRRGFEADAVIRVLEKIATTL